MNKLTEAISVVEQALNLANKGGIFSLRDAATVNTAFTIIKEASELQTIEPEVITDVQTESK